MYVFNILLVRRECVEIQLQTGLFQVRKSVDVVIAPEIGAVSQRDQQIPRPQISHASGNGTVYSGREAHLPEPWCRSEEHTSELQSLMSISYAVFCLKTTQHLVPNT